MTTEVDIRMHTILAQMWVPHCHPKAAATPVIRAYSDCLMLNGNSAFAEVTQAVEQVMLRDTGAEMQDF